MRQRPPRYETAWYLQAVDRLTRAGLSASQIAAKLFMDPRTVHRYRARARASQTGAQTVVPPAR